MIHDHLISQDKEEPATTDTHLSNVPFHAKFAEELNTTSFSEDPGSDGYVINSAPLFEVRDFHYVNVLQTIFNLSVYSPNTRVTRNHFVFKKYPGLEQNKINSEFLLRKFLPTCVSRLGVNFLRSYWFVFRSSFYNKKRWTFNTLRHWFCRYVISYRLLKSKKNER